MRPTESLTPLGILRRQRPLAEWALAQYPISISGLTLVSHATNYIYRVTADDGARYALRLVAPYWRTEQDLRAEVMWLDALARDTDIAVPEIIRTRDGEPIVYLSPGAGRPDRRAILMTWLPGMSLGRRLSNDNIRKMGALFAALHLHAGAWDPPAGFPNLQFDAFLSRGEPEVLFSDACLAAYPPEDIEVLREAHAHVMRAYAALDRDDLRVIHCDLWHANVKLYEGELAPFDFEDTVWGFRMHDIAMAMLDLAEAVGVARYEQLLEAFRRGYEAYLPFPEGDMVALQMGRVLWKINWFGQFAQDRFARAAAFHVGVLRRALTGGRLVDPLTAG